LWASYVQRQKKRGNTRGEKIETRGDSNGRIHMDEDSKKQTCTKLQKKAKTVKTKVKESNRPSPKREVPGHRECETKYSRNPKGTEE